MNVDEICAALQQAAVNTEEEMKTLMNAMKKAADTFVKGDPETRAFIALAGCGPTSQTHLIGRHANLWTLLANTILGCPEFRDCVIKALKAVCGYAAQKGGGDEEGD